MVLGLSRGRLRDEQRDLHPRFDRALPLHQWHVERGDTLRTATVELRGGFPGFARHAGTWHGAPLKITTTHLIAGDGQADGFALPLETIVGTALVRSGVRDDLELRVFFGTEDAPRCFTIAAQGVRLAGWGAPRAEELQDALCGAGISDRFADAPPELFDLAIPPDAFRPFDDDNVMWSGRASAPVHPGGAVAPAKVWLTTRAVVWKVAATLNRLPLTMVTGMAIAGRVGGPESLLVSLTAGDDATGLFEMAFVFDQESVADRNRLERGAFVVGLRSRGVREQEPLPSWQPWQQEGPEPDIWFGDGAGRDTVIEERPARGAERELSGIRARAEATLQAIAESIATMATGETVADLPATLEAAEIARAESIGGDSAARLIAINEAAVRLVTFIELHRRGLLSGEDLLGRRDQVLAGLRIGEAAD